MNALSLSRLPPRVVFQREGEGREEEEGRKEEESEITAPPNSSKVGAGGEELICSPPPFGLSKYLESRSITTILSLVYQNSVLGILVFSLRFTKKF
jgi:hypothetical protein